MCAPTWQTQIFHLLNTDHNLILISSARFPNYRSIYISHSIQLWMPVFHLHTFSYKYSVILWKSTIVLLSPVNRTRRQGSYVILSTIHKILSSPLLIYNAVNPSIANSPGGHLEQSQHILLLALECQCQLFR